MHELDWTHRPLATRLDLDSDERQAVRLSLFLAGLVGTTFAFLLLLVELAPFGDNLTTLIIP